MAVGTQVEVLWRLDSCEGVVVGVVRDVSFSRSFGARVDIHFETRVPPQVGNFLLRFQNGRTCRVPHRRLSEHPLREGVRRWHLSALDAAVLRRSCRVAKEGGKRKSLRERLEASG